MQTSSAQKLKRQQQLDALFVGSTRFLPYWFWPAWAAFCSR
nr:hypothetical protein [Neisseria weixii]